jgi:hypothetical protein
MVIRPYFFLIYVDVTSNLIRYMREYLQKHG